VSRFRDRVIVVTGASSGIGHDLAKSLARKGALVIAAARDQARLDRLAARTGIEAVRTDVTVDADRAALIATTLDRHGRIDALVNNAGLGYAALVGSMTTEKVQQLFDVNIIGMIDLTQRVLPEMLERGDGHVVNVASVAGYFSSPRFAVYNATKHAVVGFTDSLRRELVGSGVRAHLVCPGPIRTEWLGRSTGEEPAEGAKERRRGMLPASVVVHTIERCLVSPTSRRVTSPRIFGAARIANAPGMRWVIDQLSGRVARRMFPLP